MGFLTGRGSEGMMRVTQDVAPFLNCLSDAVLTVDGDGKTRFANKSAERIFGYSRDEMVGQSLRALFAADSWGPCDQAFARAGALGAERFSVTCVRKCGDTFPATLSVVQAQLQDEPLTHLVVHDQSPYLEQKAALEEANAALRAVIQASPLAIYTVDRDAIIRTWNPAAERIFGWSSDELIGKALPTIPETEMSEFRRLFRRALDGDILTELEVRRYRKDGQLIDVSLSTAPLRHPSGRTWGVMAIMADITERKEAERQLKALNEELRHLNETLEERVRERTRAAEERAHELAVLNAELEQFAYVASHDLQEPLRMVASFTQLLQRRYQGKLDADADEFIGHAVEGAMRMQSLIHDLLAFSRTGNRLLQWETVDLNDIVDQVVFDLAGAIQETGATIARSPLPAVRGDASQLGRLLLNILSNAIKFRGADPPVIRVWAEVDGPKCTVSISDNGIGIAEEHMERIFNIFQRLHARDRYPGTGIGLAICKKIVERHGGRLWVESKLGEGSVFRFTVTRADESESEGKGK